MNWKKTLVLGECTVRSAALLWVGCGVVLLVECIWWIIIATTKLHNLQFIAIKILVSQNLNKYMIAIVWVYTWVYLWHQWECWIVSWWEWNWTLAVVMADEEGFARQTGEAKQSISLERQSPEFMSSRRRGEHLFCTWGLIFLVSALYGTSSQKECT